MDTFAQKWLHNDAAHYSVSSQRGKNKLSQQFPLYHLIYFIAHPPKLLTTSPTKALLWTRTELVVVAVVVVAVPKNPQKTSHGFGRCSFRRRRRRRRQCPLQCTFNRTVGAKFLLATPSQCQRDTKTNAHLICETRLAGATQMMRSNHDTRSRPFVSPALCGAHTLPITVYSLLKRLKPPPKFASVPKWVFIARSWYHNMIQSMWMNRLMNELWQISYQTSSLHDNCNFKRPCSAFSRPD